METEIENADENAKVSENESKNGFCKSNKRKIETEMKTLSRMQKKIKMKTNVAEPPRIR